MEVTTGYRLLGTSVGSLAFAKVFFNEQIAEVEKDVENLHTHIHDLQT